MSVTAYMYISSVNTESLFVYVWCLECSKLGQKKLIICFSGTAHVTFNAPASKISIAFPVFTLKKRLYIANCQFRSAVICRHFVC